jgi:long-chain acyl-CoA synthetase
MAAEPAQHDTSQPALTIPALLIQRLRQDADRPALYVPRGGQFDSVCWASLIDAAARLAAGLSDLGLQPGDRVAVVSPNRYEWVVCDLAILGLGAVHVPIHNALAGPQIAWQIRDCGARLVLLAGPDQASRLSGVSELPAEVRYAAFDPCHPELAGTPVLPWTHWHASPQRGRELIQHAAATVQPSQLATILYTSGTTGEPKGVMLSHANLISNARATLQAFGHDPADLRLCWLPLSHVFARTCDLYITLVAGTPLALAESPEKVMDNCKAIRPTLMCGVPYFFEKVQRTLCEQGRADEPGALANAFGGRIRVLTSGGAALPDHVARFYHERGVMLVQGYGLTESSPVITVSTPGQVKIGTVGRPIPGVDVRIAPDGEILTRGPHVMLGYWNKPQATAETIRDGWLHTGDLGELDADGFLRITGRKKELIVTAGGKNVPPVYLEALLTADPLIQQAMIVGEGRKFLAALIVPAPEALRAEIIARRIPVTSAAEALRHPHVLALYEERIRARLANVSHYEQVAKFVLLNRAFSIEQGELTPTLKLRRSVIQEHFAEEIERMYG